MYYRGESPRLNFEKFVEVQKDCYKRLRDVGYNDGRGLDDASKCSNLEKLETALSMARTHDLFNVPFDELIYILKAEVDELTLRRTQQRANRSQRVSAVGFQRGPVGGGGYQGRGGRGRVRSNSRNFRPQSGPTRMVEGRQIHSGSYSIEEYRRLTPTQREAVKELHR